MLIERKQAAMRNEKEAISTWMGPLAIALDTKLSGPAGKHTKVSHLHPHRLRTLCEQFVIATKEEYGKDMTAATFLQEKIMDLTSKHLHCISTINTCKES